MTSTIQRAELQAKIWKIANEVRGSVDIPVILTTHFRCKLTTLS